MYHPWDLYLDWSVGYYISKPQIAIKSNTITTPHDIHNILHTSPFTGGAVVHRIDLLMVALLIKLIIYELIVDPNSRQIKYLNLHFH